MQSLRVRQMRLVSSGRPARTSAGQIRVAQRHPPEADERGAPRAHQGLACVGQPLLQVAQARRHDRDPGVGGGQLGGDRGETRDLEERIARRW